MNWFELIFLKLENKHNFHMIDQKKVEKEYHCDLGIPHVKWRVSWNYI